MEPDNLQLYSKLERLFVANPEFEELEKAIDVFCPFEAIGMVRQEVRHAHFLSYILDPNRPHGFGTECIRALMTTFARVALLSHSDSVLSPLDVHLTAFQTATVRREWERIDLLIELPEQKIIIAIELKIDASEHSEQLSRYRDKVRRHWPEENWKHFFLFLTKRGDDPTEVEREKWLPIPLDEYVSELDILVSKEIGNLDARRLLANYLSMLRRHHLKNEKLEDLAARLWSQHYDALAYLVDQRPNPLKDIYKAVFDQRFAITEAISDLIPFKLEVDDCTPSSLHFAVADWDDLPGFRTASWTSTKRILLIEVERGKGADIPIRIRFVLGKGDPAVRQAIYDTLKTHGTFEKLTAREKFSNEWTRLTSYTIKPYNPDEERDVDSIAADIKDAIVKYAVKNVPLYDAALRRMR